MIIPSQRSFSRRSISRAFAAFLAAGACLIFSGGSARGEEAAVEGNWMFRPDPLCIGVKEGWMKPDLKEADWQAVAAGESWASYGYFNYSGVGWYRKRIDIPARFRGGFIIFEGVNESCTVYFDGKEMTTKAPAAEPRFRGTYTGSPPFRLRLPEAARIDVAIRVTGADTHKIGSAGPGLAGPVKLSDSVLFEFRGYWLAPDEYVSREEWLKAMRRERARRREGLHEEGRIYEGAYAWSRRNFVEGFVFVYDTRFYDEEHNRYKLDEYLDDGVRRFGGYDSLLIWHAYPNIGVDDQNQFQMLGDLPGGLPGFRAMVGRAHERGVKIYIAYNPWDRKTRQETVAPEQSLAEAVRATEADGIFLDVTDNGPAEKLRQAVDAARPGVALEPEGYCYSDGGLETINGGWGQAFPCAGYFEHLRGVPVVKWTEPRYMLHYDGDRWRTSRVVMLQHVFLNGAGVCIWEDIFGTWNGYSERDQAIVRRMAPIQRYAADLLASEDWEPFHPTLAAGVDAARWAGEGRALWTVVNWSDEPRRGPLLRLPHVAGARYFDLWNGVELHPKLAHGEASVTIDLEARGFGAVFVQREAPEAGLRELLARQRREAGRRISDYADDWPIPIVPRVKVPAKTPRASTNEPPAEMVFVPATGPWVMTVTHNLGEGGCYPDDGGAEWSGRRHFMYENGDHKRNIIHQIPVPGLPAFYMDKFPVTQGRFREFLEASGYRPLEEHNFLRDWDWSDRAHPRPVAGRENHPVTWVDLEEARAYARWTGKRLPTEEEWHYAAGGRDGARYPWGGAWQAGLANDHGEGTTAVGTFPAGASPFGAQDTCGNVWQWTESERDDGNRYALLRGGSYYQVGGSGWYFDRFVAKGLGAGEWSARPIGYHAKLFLMTPGMNRKGTIGFRCVKDVAQ